MAEKTATFALDLKSNAREVAGGARREVESFQKSIESSQASLKGMQGALRSLRGSSDEVAAAKTALKAKIDAEKGAISQANLALLKHGVTYDQVTKAQNKARSSTDAVKAGIKAAGGPVNELRERFEGLKGVLGGSNAGAAALAVGMGALVVAVAAVATGVIAAGVALGKFILTSADSLRSMQLLREGTGTSAKNAENLGTQVDRIARLVPTAKEEINKLGVTLVRSLSGGLSRANGQTIVDTFEAVSVASAAAGDSVGNTLKGLVERGKQWNRFSLTPQDLDNTGLRFGQVAEALSKRMHIGLEEAKAALFTGRVGLAAGAAALKDAVNARFGQVNAKQLLSVDVQLEKLKENLVSMSKNVALEPLLRGLAGVLQKFDPASKSGQRLQASFEKIGNAIARLGVKTLEKLPAIVEKLPEQLRLVADGFDKWEPRIARVVGWGLKLGEAFFTAQEGAGKVLGFIAQMGSLTIGKVFDVEQWKSLGKRIVDGLIEGIKGGAGALWNTVSGLAGTVKNAFTGGLKIRSPSKVFEEYGKQTTAGYVGGMKASRSSAQEAADALAPAAPGRSSSSGASSSGAAAGGGNTTGPISITIVLPPGMAHAKGEELRAAVTAPDVLRAMTRAIREGLISQGIPTQAQVTP